MVAAWLETMWMGQHAAGRGGWAQGCLEMELVRLASRWGAGEGHGEVKRGLRGTVSFISGRCGVPNRHRVQAARVRSTAGLR